MAPDAQKVLAAMAGDAANATAANTAANTAIDANAANAAIVAAATTIGAGGAAAAAAAAADETANQLRPSIPDWFAGKCILVSGATGFMGKVLVEKLLRDCPLVERLYLLVRRKRGVEPEHRRDEYINHMVSGERCTFPCTRKGEGCSHRIYHICGSTHKEHAPNTSLVQSFNPNIICACVRACSATTATGGTGGYGN